MDDETRYRVNAPGVVAESLDGEVLIVNLESGCYFSAAGSGEAIWALLAAGKTTHETLAGIQDSYLGDHAAIADEVVRLRNEFLAEGLLVAGGVARDGAGVPTTDGRPFERPELKKYTDMQDLLLLDPVHDVDEEAGWPTARA